MNYEITESARKDIKNILTETVKIIGTHQLDVYQKIIDQGILMISDDPDRASALDRPEIAADIKLFHLELAAGKSGAAAHCLYYKIGRMSDDNVGVLVLRVLHESMEPRYKVVRAMNAHLRSQHEETTHGSTHEEPEDPFKHK